MFKISWAGKFLAVQFFLLTLILPSHALNVVNNNPNGEGSLTWAVEQINSGTSSTITISPDLKTLHLSQELTFTRSAAISGKGTLIDGEETRRLFRVTNGRVIFEGLAFTRGNAVSGSGGAVEVDGSGASAEFRNCIFYNNSARDYGGAVSVTKGDNINPTILKHCTITANTSTNGGGVSVSNGQLQSLSSIIVGNTSSYDISANGTGIFSSRYSIAGTSNTAMDTTDLNGQNVTQVLVSENGVAKLETLNGSQVIRITRSSPAFNFVKDSQYALSSDIAGTIRPQYGAYDAGAYEIPAVALKSADIDGVPYIKIGDNVTFSLDIIPSNATLNSKDYQPAGIVWQSSNTEAITASNTGNVTALKAGVSDIWAEVHGWDSQGRNFTAESKHVTVCAGDEAFTEIRAEISSADNQSILAGVKMNTGETKTFSPNVHILIDRYELDETDGVYYTLNANSSRTDIVTADVNGDSVSGYILTLKAGNIAGSSDVTLETHTIPEGRTLTQGFTVSVVNASEPVSNDTRINGLRGVGGGGGGCNTGVMILSGIMIALIASKKGEH
ncbi:MAG: hypothetical protein IJQ08_04320 [Synergistaceae bacterium]|nr:hypothetical protein [Synergistaceae bacterium]